MAYSQWLTLAIPLPQLILKLSASFGRGWISIASSMEEREMHYGHSTHSVTLYVPIWVLLVRRGHLPASGTQLELKETLNESPTSSMQDTV